MPEPIIEIEDGKLKGTFRESYNGEQIYTFLGIPYGKPPVGELRFKAPLPAEPWGGVRDATQDGSACYQGDLFSTSYNGSEDCLFLNVFTKDISDNQQLKPVLVFIHGGGFISGSSDSKMFSPNFLLMEDIVLVTINYRLGILGFLRLKDSSLGVTGNAGLKDQVLALKWVQRNIRRFGGDKDNVTIFGESAGSASVNYHVISPASKGLFHKAIMNSGSVLNPWPYLRENCLDVMKYIKNDCKNEAEILETLLKIPASDLIDAQHKIRQEWVDDKIRSFAPCIETPNESAFLTRNPIDIITSGDYNDVPMIIGYCTNEGLLISMGDFLYKPGNSQTRNIEYEYYIPQQMKLPDDSNLKRELCDKLKKMYSNDRPGDLYVIAGDAYFVAGIMGLIQNLAKTSSNPIYLHRLNLCTTRNVLKKILSAEGPGAAHGDDLGYFFEVEIPLIPKVSIAPGSIEERAIKRYVRLWGNFLKYGNPTPDQKEFGLTWEPVKENNVLYLDIDEELTVGANPDAERMQLWREIYKSNENTKNFMP